MNWNYRVAANMFTHCFDIIEVYYDEEGNPTGWTQGSVAEWAKEEDLKGTLEMMIGAFDKPTIILLEDGKLMEQ